MIRTPTYILCTYYIRTYRVCTVIHQYGNFTPYSYSKFNHKRGQVGRRVQFGGSWYKVFPSLPNNWWKHWSFFLLCLNILGSCCLFQHWSIICSLCYHLGFLFFLFLDILIYCLWPMEHSKMYSKQADPAPQEQPHDQLPPPYEAVPQDLSEAQGISVNGKQRQLVAPF